MRLYHGTNQAIEKIDLSRGAFYKDFSKGFYVTPNRDTTLRMAKKRTMLNGGIPILITYEFDESALVDEQMKVKTFMLDEEWIEFININRDKAHRGKRHNYDIVIGPIADDGVAYLLGRWNEGTKLLDAVLKQLRGRFLDTQYYFGSDYSLRFLKLINTELV